MNSPLARMRCWRVSIPLCVWIQSIQQGHQGSLCRDSQHGQGWQFTSTAFTSVLLDADVAILSDGVGPAIDNMFIERLLRTLKFDDLYLNPADNGTACRAGITTYLRY